MTKVAGQRPLTISSSKQRGKGKGKGDSRRKKTRAKEVGIEEGRGEEGMEVWVNLEMDKEKPRDDAFAVTRRHAQLSTALSVGWNDCAKDRKLSSNPDTAQNKEDVISVIPEPL